MESDEVNEKVKDKDQSFNKSLSLQTDDKL